MPHEQQQQHSLRFYIVMTTLVVAGIIFLLYWNESKDFSLTSAIVGVAKNDTLEKEEQTATETESLEHTFGKSARRSTREVDISVLFDQIPAVRQEAKVQDLEVRFDNLNTKITVNNDRLELNNLQQVTLRMKGFNGQLDLDKVSFSVAGTAKSIEVNDIALSSKGEIKIAFDDLQYDYLGFEDITLDTIELPHGNGQLTVADKLTYELEQDEVKIYLFNGKTVVDRSAADILSLEGIAKGISVSGALLDLNLQ
ncbi:MAG: hypothetical protein AABX13_05030 [Nanoarchaeota archaeon]